MTYEVKFMDEAFVKPLLHAVKYPHCYINGVFLSDNKIKNVNEIIAVDAIPLFHSTITLAPMMEVALTQIDSYCKNKDYSITGYYQANENFNDSSPQGVAYKIGRKIKENNPESFITMINNDKLSSNINEVFAVHQNVDGKWKKMDKGPTVDDNVGNIVSSLIKSRTYRSIIDFDNHLDDISQDWKNTNINHLISKCV